MSSTPGGDFGPGDHLYLIDGSGYIFRAYHALPPLTRKSDGMPIGAISGFCNMLWKLLEDNKAGDRPTHIAVIFDAGRTTFRDAIYSEYKANRDDPPDDLIPQFPLTRDATRAFGVCCLEQEGFEADDLIATYAKIAAAAGGKTTIVSSDKDLMQLVIDGKVEMFDPVKQKRILSAEVVERFGVPPEKVTQVQALMGDSVDNVPGVPGIGVKTAAELIGQYGDLETLLARASEIKQPKRRESLITYADKARVSLQLVTLKDDSPITHTLGDFKAREPATNELVPFLQLMEFTTLLKRIAARLDLGDIEAIPAAAAAREEKAKGPHLPLPKVDMEDGDTGQLGVVVDRAAHLKPIDYGHYQSVTELPALVNVIEAAAESGLLGLSLEAGDSDPMTADIIGLSLSTGPGKGIYVPLHHRSGEGLLGEEVKQLTEDLVLEKLRPLLESETILKVAHNVKLAYALFLRRGIRMVAVDDPMLMSYVLDAGLHGHGLEELSETFLQHKPIALSDVTGKGRERVKLEQVSVADATRYSAENADIALRLNCLLKPRLVAERRMRVYELLERPLISVLAEMEAAGILISPDFLSKLSNDFAKQCALLETQIHGLAGEDFNLGSPKQLGDILFGKFSLPGGKRTKTGAWSTDADILEELAAQGHELPERILEWRQLSKLQSTYTDALPQHINTRTHRVHTSYAMGATTTGRLSSTEPNLQNIPIRTEEGRRIRQAFIAPKGMKLVSADYSQIELRILAHMADVPALRQAFADGLDIHAMTASEMFGVPLKDMTPEIRRGAKAINFGIIYGISAFGLANQLGIPRGEADAYIKKYFERFPGIRAYMDETKAYVREHGFVETLFGRRIHIKDVKAGNPSLRAFGERQAINAPIQGSAADIIRRAMVRLPEALAEHKLSARLLLQVHDELVIEAPAEEAEEVCALARRVMERATMPALELVVPLVVDARAGDNWDQAH